jgi:hypothetical protein
MRRTLSLLIAALLVALMPVSVLAQEVEFEAELGDLGTAIDGVAGESAEEWGASLAEATAALEVLKGVAADLDYAELDAAIADLEAAIEGGDLAEIAAAAEALAPAFVALEAQAADDGTEEPTAVDTGSGVDQGPNLGLLGVAGLLALLAAGAWALRPAASRR